MLSRPDPRAIRRVTVSGLAVTAALGLAVTTAAPAAAGPAARPVAKAAAVERVAGPLMNYAVNAPAANRGQTLKVERAVRAAGGSVVASYAEIGVVIAQSDDASFALALRQDAAVESVGATRTAAVQATDLTYRASDPLAKGESGKTPNRRQAAPTVETPTTVVADPREVEQWDMAQIGALAAHAVEDGNRDVLVAVLDSGIQGDHPDVQANLDTAASAGCLSGSADSRYAAWQPTTSDHGTHVAGTIAAARNGVGIVGVAPGVRMSAVKVVNDDGFIYPEAAICGFLHAAATGADITNNSYYIDPWEFWCGSDPDQAAVKQAIDRAVQYTQDRGVVHVAAAGNSAKDLANKTTDTGSPNDTTPVTRQLDAGCEDLPTELDGVVTVASTDRTGVTSSFSNYGYGVIDIAAPGRSILSTTLTSKGTGYGLKSGTSMASPHVAGVLALLKSAHPELSGQALVDRLLVQADDTACVSTATQVCQGTPALNGFFGEGLVDALEAVS